MGGAASMNAEVLVIPDVGCGVYGNDPEVMGEAFGRVLYSYPCYFAEVVVVGRYEFFSAASKAAGSRYNIMCRQPFDLPEKINNGAGKGPLPEPSCGVGPLSKQIQGFLSRGDASVPLCGCTQGLCAFFRIVSGWLNRL